MKWCVNSLQSSSLFFRIFSRIAIMIKTAAKKQKKQNKEIPAQEISVLKCILLSSMCLLPVEFLGFYRKFFV